MAKGTREWTQAKFERYCKEKRGEGSGESYKPWITIHDFPSRGRSTRTSGWKTNRVHHFLSDHEKRLFYLFEWSDIVVDIREQFPLLDLDLAMNIATDMGIKYPAEAQNGTPYVLTSDFMLSINRKGKSLKVARTVKTSKDLEKKRVAEKLEIEKQYWKAKGINWGIVTEKEIPRILADNIEWIHSAYKLEPTSGMDVEQMQEIAIILKSQLNSKLNDNIAINKITTALDTEMNIETGTSLYLFRHLIAKKEIIIDMMSNKISVFSAKDIQKIIY